ncbi:hypothetical protein ACFE04_009123 [Oxalis oulophora]
MSFGRGRGRGRGGWSSGGGGGFNYNITAKPFELWPDIVLPKVNIDVEEVEEEEDLTISSYWKTSPYHLVEETIAQNNESNFEVETFADWKKTKRKASKRDMFQFLQLHLRNFPKELIGDSKSQCRVPKRVRWSAEQDFIKLDELAKREQEQKLKVNAYISSLILDHEGKCEKEKKDGDEDEDEDDDEAKEDEEESSDGGDYDKNIDFDDDEDGFNMVDDGNDDDDAVY